MKNTHALVVLATFALACAQACGATPLLDPELAPGQSFGTVFSILRSVKAEGYDPYAGRNGGSADYTVLAVHSNVWRLHSSYRYDGRTEGAGEVEIRDGGRTNCSLKPDGSADCQPALDASGLLYNPLLWGSAPMRLSPGMTWSVNIAPAWELGGANGKEQVTVVSVDRATGTVVLLRVGSSDGFFGEGEPVERQLTRDGKTESLEVIPGKAHWRGYTTMVKGIVFSDELLVTRDSMMRNKVGQLVHASERWIMLLNAAPYPTLS
jgi:hypothetical protein